MVNINQIAKFSGYSKSTVSRYINQNGYVSDFASHIIQETMDKFDYAPNAMARNLNFGNSHIIGVVIPYMKSTYFTQILSGIMEAALLNDFYVLVLPSQYNEDSEVAYLEKLRHKEIDGLIFISRDISIQKIVPYAKYGSIVCCESIDEKNLGASYAIRDEAYVNAFTWLKEKNYKNIEVYLSRDTRSSATSRETVLSYNHVFDTPLDMKRVEIGVTTFSEGYQRVKEKFEVSKDVEAFFANNDAVAAGIRQFYIDNHFAVPIVIGQGNEIVSYSLNMPTIDHHFKQIGQSAFNLIQKKSIKHIEFHSKFLSREID